MKNEGHRLENSFMISDYILATNNAHEIEHSHCVVPIMEYEMRPDSLIYTQIMTPFE